MIPYGRHHIDDEDIRAVTELLQNGSLTQGPLIEIFEKKVAQYVGVKYAVAVSSGTAGLHIAAISAGIAPGRTLVTSPITFVSSANAALFSGGKPLFADINPETVNLCPVSLEEIVENRDDVAVIMPVHFAGLPCDMPEIKRLAAKQEAVVIEDAAHALGSKYIDGTMVGSCKHSDMTVFSFHPVKAIAAGEGGMVTTNNEDYYRQLLRLRSHGINKLHDPFELPEQAVEDDIPSPWYYEMQELGFNYRITDIQCSLAISQLAKLEAFLKRRRDLAAQYDAAFSGMQYIRPAQSGVDGLSAYHLYVVRIDFKGAGYTRSNFMQELKARGIGSQVHYIPVPAQPYYRKLGYSPEEYPHAYQYYHEALSIPLFYDLTDEMQQLVIDVIKDLLN